MFASRETPDSRPDRMARNVLCATNPTRWEGSTAIPLCLPLMRHLSLSSLCVGNIYCTLPCLPLALSVRLHRERCQLLFCHHEVLPCTQEMVDWHAQTETCFPGGQT